MKTSEVRKEFVNLFECLAQKYSRHQIWSDFIIMSACAISNACDRRFFDVREAMYMDCVKKYKREEAEVFPEMLSLVVIAFEINPEQDFLGEIFGSLRLHNEWRGQFFTPYHVAKLMADINTGSLVKDIEEKGTVSVSDCCCGAGCLLIAFANSAKRAGVNYQRNILFVAQDVDLIAGLMCYIQLSILGCKAYIKIGNSLTEPITTDSVIDETFWFTPMYRMGNLLTFMELFDETKNENFRQQEEIPA